MRGGHQSRAGGEATSFPPKCPHGSELPLEGSSEEPSPWDSLPGCPQGHCMLGGPAPSLVMTAGQARLEARAEAPRGPLDCLGRSPVLVLRQREVPVFWGALPGRPHQAMLPCSPNSGPLAFTQGPLGFGAAALLPLAAAGQVAPPLPAGRPLAVDVVVAQEVPGAAAELPLRAVGLARARRPPAFTFRHVPLRRRRHHGS